MKKFKIINCLIFIVLIFLAGTFFFNGPVSAKELAYDDGESDAYVGLEIPIRQRFLLSDFGLSGASLIEKVRIYWNSIDVLSGTITLRDYENPQNSVTLNIENPQANTWQEYDVSALSFVSSHFYVELWPSIADGSSIGSDTDAPHHDKSEVRVLYLSANLDPWRILPGNDFMIRVEIQEERPLGALPVSQCLSLYNSETEKLSASVSNDFRGCIIESSVRFYRSSDCSGDPITPRWEEPSADFVYKSGTMGGCPEAVEVTKSSPVCVTLTLASGRKTTVCY